MTSPFEPSGQIYLPDIRPYFNNIVYRTTEAGKTNTKTGRVL